MLLRSPRSPLVPADLPALEPGAGELRVRVAACGVCRTDLHVADGELTEPKLPIVLGHEIVGRVDALGPGVDRFRLGDRVGIPWLGWTCGRCPACVSGRENLCPYARFTGYQRDGGYAEAAIADARYAFPLPEGYSDAEAAPLLCAGLIGYRAWGPVRDARRLGIYGFGAAAHIVAQLARHAGQRVFAFTRPGDADAQAFARTLGAEWTGASGDAPPEPLDAAILFAPVGALVPAALAASAPGADAARAAGTRAPTGANRMAASSGSGGASSDAPAHSAPSPRAKACAAASPRRVNANTRCPAWRASCATRWAAAPKP